MWKKRASSSGNHGGWRIHTDVPTVLSARAVKTPYHILEHPVPLLVYG